MDDKDELILAAASHIQSLCGAYPEEISQNEDRSYAFTVKTHKTALDVFPYDDEEPRYCMVNTEINGDEKGWYEETLLFQKKPNSTEDGYLIEGIYGRNIEYRDEPDAEFVGTYRRVGTHDDWGLILSKMVQLHDERTAEKLLSFVENEVRILGDLTARLGTTPAGVELKKRYREMVQGSLRRHMGMPS